MKKIMVVVNSILSFLFGLGGILFPLAEGTKVVSYITALPDNKTTTSVKAWSYIFGKAADTANGVAGVSQNSTLYLAFILIAIGAGIGLVGLLFRGTKSLGKMFYAMGFTVSLIGGCLYLNALKIVGLSSYVVSAGGVSITTVEASLGIGFLLGGICAIFGAVLSFLTGLFLGKKKD